MFIKNVFSWKCSSGLIEWSFENPAENFLPKDQKVFAQNPEIFEKYIFSKNKISLKVFLMTSRIQVWQTCQKFLAESPKKIEIYNSFNKTICPRKFIWTRRNEFQESSFLTNIVLTALKAGVLAF